LLAFVVLLTIAPPLFEVAIVYHFDVLF